MANLRKTAFNALKILISFLLIYFIITKIDVPEIWLTLKTSNIGYLLLAVLFFVTSKVIAAFRLNRYFHQIGVPLTQKSNLQLYFLGMFYNLFLPGGIGGDAYKGYRIKKDFKAETKKVVGVLVLDRLGGLLLLFIYACLLASLLAIVTSPYTVILWVAIPLAILSFWLLNKYFFSYALPVFWNSIGYSAGVQLSQLVCVWFLMLALDITTHTIAYSVIFLISSIVAILPLTIGGLGSRELTFYYGATLLNLNANDSIGISVLFFLITALVSLVGIVYHFKKIKLHTVSKGQKI